MDILVTCLNYPFPLENGENLRIFHYVRALRSRHNFDLVCLGDDEVPSPLRDLFRRIVSGPANASPASVLTRLTTSFSVDSVQPPIPALSPLIERALEEGPYDLIWTSADIFPSLPARALPPILGDIVDDLVVQYSRLLSTRTLGIRYVRLLKRLWLARAYERKYFSRAQACLYVSEVDARQFSELCPTTPVHVIPNGVDETFFVPSDAPVEYNTLVFEGSMNFFPNVDAAVYFCEEIFPLIREQRTGVKLYLVGRDPAPRVKALASNDVVVTGRVEDVRPYLTRASVFVSPTRVGGGIKNKILQAWAMGKPVVATPASTGGLRVENDRNIAVRDTPKAFAEAVLQLLKGDELRARMGLAGRQTILEHYTWDAKARELEALMTQLARGSRKAPIDA